MAHYPYIDFVTADGKISYQAELDCSVNQINWLNEEHDHINDEIAKKVAVAKENLINKYSIEEI